MQRHGRCRERWGGGGTGQGEEVGRLPGVKGGEFAENRVTPCVRQLGLL